MYADIDLVVMESIGSVACIKELSEFVSTVWNPLDLFAIDKLKGNIKWIKNQVEVDRLKISGSCWVNLKEYDFDNGYRLC